MIRVFGQITDASGKGVAGAMIELRALKSSTEVLYGSVFTYKCDASGHYEFPLAIGAYDAYAQNDICGDMDYLGTAVVTADTNDGDLHHILVDGGINITPPMLDAAMEFALRAEIAATSAESDRIQTGKDVIVTGQNKQVAETKAQESATSADEAKAARDSIVQDANEVRLNTQQVADNAASVDSNTVLVQRKAEQVAQNTQTVSTKAQQVSENTQSVAANTQVVSLMRDEVVAKTSMAQAAADTATQKAASAAEHDAAAAEYARQAQEAAQATAGALIDGGAADLSTGVYPQPVQVSGTARPTFWKVTKGGTVGGVDYGVGDTLIYTVAGSGSYYKIDNTESVTSVQGEKGAVTLTPEKIGAEPVGVSVETVLQHEQKRGAHAISGIAGLEERLAALEGDTAVGSGGAEKAPNLRTEISLISEEATKVSTVWSLSGYYYDTPFGYKGIWGVLQVIRGSSWDPIVLRLSLFGINAGEDKDRKKEYIRKGWAGLDHTFRWGDWYYVFDSAHKPKLNDIEGLEQALASKAVLGYGFAEQAPYLSQSIDLTSEEVISVSRIWTLNAHYAGIPSELSTATGFLEVLRSSFNGHHTILFLHLTSGTNGFAYKSYKRIGQRIWNGDYVWSDWIPMYDANYGGSLGEVRTFSAPRPELVDCGWTLIKAVDDGAETSTKKAYTYEYHGVPGR